MATLAAILIARDEEANIEACLESVAWADEIVVVDAGSSDRTVELARRYTEKVEVRSDWAGYGTQRQRAQALASADWVFMIDADERVTPELRAAIEAVVAADRRDAVYQVSRLTWFLGRFMRHSGWYPDRVVRLYPREAAGYGDAQVHERVHHDANMKAEPLAGDLIHYSYTSLPQYLEKSSRYAEAWAEQRHARGQRAGLVQGVGHALGCFLKMYLFQAGFLDGSQGLLLALLSAHSTFIKYAALWLRARNGGAPPNE